MIELQNIYNNLQVLDVWSWVGVEVKRTSILYVCMFFANENAFHPFISNHYHLTQDGKTYLASVLPGKVEHSLDRFLVVEMNIPGQRISFMNMTKEKSIGTGLLPQNSSVREQQFAQSAKMY